MRGTSEEWRRRQAISSLLWHGIEDWIRELADENPGLELYWLLTTRLATWAFESPVDSSGEPKVDQAWDILARKIENFIKLADPEDHLRPFLIAEVGKWTVRAGWGDVSIPSSVLRASDKTNVFHRPGCRRISDILPRNMFYFGSADQAQSVGFRGCMVCTGIESRLRRQLVPRAVV